MCGARVAATIHKVIGINHSGDENNSQTSSPADGFKIFAFIPVLPVGKHDCLKNKTIPVNFAHSSI